MVNPNSFISIQEVMSTVLVALNDEETRLLSTGFYRGQIKDAIDAIGFMYPFVEGQIDRPIPTNHIVSFPDSAYRIKHVYIYTGSPDDIGYVQTLYHKKNARGEGYGKGYTSDNHPGNYSDPHFGGANPVWGSSDIAYFFSYVNGNIMLSDPCVSYDYTRIIYDGIVSGILDEQKLIPPEARDAIELRTIDRCAGFLKLRDSAYRTVQLDAAEKLDEFGENGAWAEARRRLKYLGKKIMKDTLEFNARPRA